MYGILLALAAAVLFGAATPAAKMLLAELGAFQLAGLFYLGAALGIAPSALWRRQRRDQLASANRNRLFGAVVFGGVLGPVLLLFGLRLASAGSVSLLLNFEIAATAIVGVLFFGESLGRRGWFGVAGVIVAGSVLSWKSGWPGIASAALVAAACACWGLDNNLTAVIDGMSASETTLWKAAIAGTTNVLIGVTLEPLTGSAAAVAAALVVGMLSYGISIALYITAAHQEGAVRAQSVFAAAPFVGAALSWIALGEPVEGAQILAGAFFIVAVALVAIDRHSHTHIHEDIGHVHGHRHDDGHHDHPHEGLLAATRHTHWHRHEQVAHAHPHRSDLHHRHGR